MSSPYYQKGTAIPSTFKNGPNVFQRLLATLPPQNVKEKFDNGVYYDPSWMMTREPPNVFQRLLASENIFPNAAGKYPKISAGPSGCCNGKRENFSNLPMIVHSDNSFY
jgi:hypothetical protein